MDSRIQKNLTKIVQTSEKIIGGAILEGSGSSEKSNYWNIDSMQRDLKFNEFHIFTKWQNDVG